MKTFRILQNGMIKTYINGTQSTILFNTNIQINGLLSDGFIQC